MKLFKNANHPFAFVLDTEAGPENRVVNIDAPTAEKAEELIAEEYGTDVCIVSINGVIVNRHPKLKVDAVEIPCLKSPSLLESPKKDCTDKVEVSHGGMLPGATLTKKWG